MRYLSWVWKLALFIALFGFALKNTDPVVVRYYFGLEWQAPLVFALLAFFAGGAALGVLASLAFVFRQHRELSALRRKLRAQGGEGEGTT
ncbi:MAG: LapA family protein [Pseudomonadota bacterium]